MLFEGPTGVGKTTVAKSIAAELGACEFGGLEEIKSGMQDQEAVLRALDTLRYTPMMGSGWKVIIADEADMMSTHAQRIWLSAIEDLPPRSVVIFTTNNPEKFPDRFLDRCERFRFDADAADTPPGRPGPGRSHLGGRGRQRSVPRAESLPNSTDKDGQISYRRVVEALKSLLDTRKAGPLHHPRPGRKGCLRDAEAAQGQDQEEGGQSRQRTGYAGRSGARGARPDRIIERARRPVRRRRERPCGPNSMRPSRNRPRTSGRPNASRASIAARRAAG